MKRYLGTLTRTFFAPDDATLAGGSSPAAPETISTATIPSTAEPSRSTFEKIDVIKELNLSGVKGPKEALGIEDDHAEAQKLSDNLKGRTENKNFKPVAPAKKPASAKPKETPKPKVDKVIPPEKPEKKEPTPPPVATEKVKLGEKEYTTAELAKIVQERETAAAEEAKRIAAEKTKVEAAKQPEPKPEEKTPEAEQAEIKERDKEFITKLAEGINLSDYGIDITNEETLDQILSGGATGLKTFTDTLAKAIAAAELRSRRFFAESANPLFARLQPLIEKDQQVQQYVRDNQFANQFPEIKSHPKGLEESKYVREVLEGKYGRFKELIAKDMATEDEVKYVQAWEKETPQEREADIAYHVRARLGIPEPGKEPTATTPAPADEEKVEPQKPTSRPKPHSGQAVGSHAAAPAKSAQRLMAEELAAI